MEIAELSNGPLMHFNALPCAHGPKALHSCAMTTRIKRDELRLYPNLDVVQYKYQGPTMGARSKRYEDLKAHILEHGVQHPVIVAWDHHAQGFSLIIGNNRVAALAEMGKRHASALVLGPAHRISWPKGEHEVIPWDENLCARLHQLWKGHDSRRAQAFPWQALVELKDVRYNNASSLL